MNVTCNVLGLRGSGRRPNASATGFMPAAFGNLIRIVRAH
jgi:hypothetical protein